MQDFPDLLHAHGSTTTESDIPKLPRIRQDDENMEKLHTAARKGQTEHIRRLLESGVPPTIQNKFNCTALHLACKHSHLSAVKVLAPVSDFSMSWHGQLPLHIAVAQNNIPIVEVLIESVQTQGKISLETFLNECDEREVNLGHRTVIGQTPLQWCVYSGDSHMDMLRLLLQRGANPSARDRNGETAVMRAIEMDNMPAFHEMTAQGQDTAEEGIAAAAETDEQEPSAAAERQGSASGTGARSGLRLDTCDRQGRTALHLALMNNRPNVALRLLAMGHDVTGETENKDTALTLAVRAAMPAVLEAILEKADQFLVLSAPFHNGYSVLPDRVQWFSFVIDGDASKNEVLKMFQARLESINKSNAPQSAADGARKKRKKRIAK